MELSKTPSMAWIGKALRIDSIEGNRVTLSPRPGGRAMVTERQQNVLARILGQVMGHQVVVRIQKAVSDLQENRGASASNTSDVAGQSQRAQAMQLPLVRQLQEHFDLTLLGVRRLAGPSELSTVSEEKRLDEDDA